MWNAEHGAEEVVAGADVVQQPVPRVPPKIRKQLYSPGKTITMNLQSSTIEKKNFDLEKILSWHEYTGNNEIRAHSSSKNSSKKISMV